MIEELKPYASYRDCGLIDRTRVPQHWKTLPTKGVFREINDRSESGKETLLSVSHISGVRRRGDLNATMFLAKSNVGHKRCQPDDLVVNTMWAWMGALGCSPYSGIVSPAYAVYRQRNAGTLLPKYADYLLRTPNYIAEYTSRSTGIHSSRLRMYPEAFFRAPLIIPPPDEQAAIVRFLDHANRRIDQFIRSKKKLIALLNEQKQAIIHHAVTRGLDPNVKLKDSGVPWLGEVPAHWEVAALRHRYTQCLGKMLDAKRITGAHLVHYLRNTDVQWGRINTRGLPKMDIPTREYERYTLRSGDLLVCEGGEVGRCALWTEDIGLCGFQKALHRLRPANAGRDDARFMASVLRTAAKSGTFDSGRVSTIAHLTGDQLRAHRFAFPPHVEQLAIVESIAVATQGLDRALASAEREIALIREYRTRLVADVVTGQVDVRAAAAGLPVEVGEPEGGLGDEDDVGDEVELGVEDAAE